MAKARRNSKTENHIPPAHLTTESTILEEAQKLIYGERNAVYKHPNENFDNIANLWNAYLLAISRRPGTFYVNDGASGKTHSLRLSLVDVAVMNILQKIARMATAQDHMDSIVDIAGYAGCIERILRNK